MFEGRGIFIHCFTLAFLLVLARLVLARLVLARLVRAIHDLRTGRVAVAAPQTP